MTVLDDLAQLNPVDAAALDEVTDDQLDAILYAGSREITGPMRRSWLAAAVVGLVIGIAGLAVWFGTPPGSDATGDEVASDDAPSISTADPDSTAASATTAASDLPQRTGALAQVMPIDVRCSSELNDTTLACTDLIDSSNAAWNDAGLQGVGATMTFTFAEPIALTQIHILNLQDELGFRRNYRVRAVEVQANDLPGLPVIAEIPDDNSRPHVVTMNTLSTTQVIISVNSTWPSEAVEGKAFDELAIQEVEFWGRRLPNAVAPPGPTSGLPSLSVGGVEYDPGAYIPLSSDPLVVVQGADNCSVRLAGASDSGVEGVELNEWAATPCLDPTEHPGAWYVRREVRGDPTTFVFGRLSMWPSTIIADGQPHTDIDMAGAVWGAALPGRPNDVTVTYRWEANETTVSAIRIDPEAGTWSSCLVANQAVPELVLESSDDKALLAIAAAVEMADAGRVVEACEWSDGTWRRLTAVGNLGRIEITWLPAPEVFDRDSAVEFEEVIEIDGAETALIDQRPESLSTLLLTDTQMVMVTAHAIGADVPDIDRQSLIGLAEAIVAALEELN